MDLQTQGLSYYTSEPIGTQSKSGAVQEPVQTWWIYRSYPWAVDAMA